MPSIYALAVPVAKAVARWQPSLAPDVPQAVALAIAKRESGFDPEARPYTTNPKDSLKVRRGGPPRLVNGKMIRSTALGPWQILDNSAPQYGITAAQRTDVDLSTKGALKVFQNYARMIKRAFPRISPDDLASAIYLGHSKGIGSLQKSLALAKQKSLAPTAENLASITPLPGGQAGFPAQLLIDVRNGRNFWQRAVNDLGNNWDGLLAWGAQQGPPGGSVLVKRGKRGAVRVSRAGGGGGGGMIIIVGVAVAALLMRKK